MRKEIFLIGSILASAAIFIAGSGLLGTLIPVRAALAGFSNLTIGVIGSGYFMGFVLGCFAGPRMVVRAGHSRTFAVGAALAAATTLFHSIFVTEGTWIVMRAGYGFAAANLYMVIESWLNERATNQTRGRIFALYLTVNFASLVVGQMLFSSNRPTSPTLFELAAVFYALCLIPVSLTSLPQPHAAQVPKLRPLRLYRIAPVGVIGCMAVGLSNSAIWTLAPVYAQDHGLTRAWLSMFMSVFTLGGALVQLPLGRLSDRFDRRYVIGVVCAVSAVLGVLLYLFGHTRTELLVLIGLFGITALPFYGLSVAHTNDRVPREVFVEVSATLLMVNALSSCFGPTLAAIVMDHFGTASLFLYTATIHTAMAGYVGWMLFTRDALIGETRDKFAAMPQQGSTVGLELDPRGPEEKQAA